MGALAERSNGFVFAFLAEFALESCTDGALHRGVPLWSILDQRPQGGPEQNIPTLECFFVTDTHLRISCNPSLLS